MNWRKNQQQQKNQILIFINKKTKFLSFKKMMRYVILLINQEGRGKFLIDKKRTDA